MKVELTNHFGDDLMVVNAARVSFGKVKNHIGDKDAKLIKYLVDHKHTAPFRHPQLQFRIECPIFVERQLFKHQVGLSANSISGRYVDFSDSYWMPDKLRFQSKCSKQGSGDDLPKMQSDFYINEMQKIVDLAKKLYSEMTEYGIAKEMCRIILPLNLQTQFIWTGSLLAFIHLWNLRIKSDTQKETRIIAEKMLELVKNIDGNPFKHTIEAFGY